MALRTRTKETVQVELREINGQKYAFHRFAEGQGPTLAGTIEYAKGKGEMLTSDEARAIRDNADSNAVFKASLKPGEWSHVRDEYSEKCSFAAYVSHYRYGMLDVFWDGGAYAASPVVVLKVGREEAAPQIRTEPVLQENMEKAAQTIQDKVSGGGAYEKEDEVYYKGRYLASTGDALHWPGTANITRYSLLNDGVFKVDVFMGEEYATIRGRTSFTIQDFIIYLRKENDTKLTQEVSESVKEILAEARR